MKSKLRAGKLSGMGLIVVNVLTGIILMPFISISNIQLVTFVLQIGVLWFGISLWIIVKYTLVGLLGLMNFSKVLNSIIILVALIGAISMMAVIFPMKELYGGSIILKVMLLVNYLIFLKKIYDLDKEDLKSVGDLHNWAISILVVAIIVFVLSFLNEVRWHIEISWIYYFLNAVPILFLIQFFKHIILELTIENKASA
jgi:hypothetical protein